MKRQAYIDFFNTPAGRELMAGFEQLIQNNYQNAEVKPEDATIYMARAAGNREAITLVQTLSAELKGGKTPQ